MRKCSYHGFWAWAQILLQQQVFCWKTAIRKCLRNFQKWFKSAELYLFCFGLGWLRISIVSKNLFIWVWARDFFFTRPRTYTSVHSIDGAASTFFFIYIFLEALDHAISSCLVPSYHLMPEQIFFHLNKGDLGNQTRAASSASERFIHYTIAARATKNLSKCWFQASLWACH